MWLSPRAGSEDADARWRRAVAPGGADPGLLSVNTVFVNRLATLCGAVQGIRHYRRAGDCAALCACGCSAYSNRRRHLAEKRFGSLPSEKVQEVIATALRDRSHFLEWRHRRLNGEALVADVLPSSA